MSVKHRLFFGLSAPALMLASCGPLETRTSERNADAKISAGEVALIASAPDGTKLWGVQPGNGERVIYFSSRGTQQTVSCGKNCTRPVYTPSSAY